MRSHEDDELSGPGLDRIKEVKIRIPVSYHIKLHSMKVLTGKAISDAVTEALDQYFRTIRDAASLELVEADDNDPGVPHD